MKKAYGYYPGCSVKGTGRAYEESLLAVFEALDVNLQELDDWNCCGATSYMSIDETEATALAARNLALADAAEMKDLMTPCNACYLVLTKTQNRLRDEDAMRHRVNDALASTGLHYDGKTRVRHPLDLLVNEIGLDAITQKVTRPLEGVKVAPYYGCQVVRPYALFDDQYDPQTMDQLLKAVGAEVIDYPMKTRCCGASQTGTMPEIGQDLVRILLKEAEVRGAQIVTTVCPLCHFNLEAFQDRIPSRWEVEPIPILHVTQLVGWAFGLSAERLGLNRCLIPAESILTRRSADVG